MEITNYLETHNIMFDIKHCCNSAATMAFPEFHLDMVRTGIALYGYHGEKTMESYIDLRPAMKLCTYAAFIKTIYPEDTVGYGRTYKAEKNTKIATIRLGYADGIPR